MITERCTSVIARAQYPPRCLGTTAPICADSYSSGTYRVVAHPVKEDLSEGAGEIAPRTYRTSGDLFGRLLGTDDE